MCLLRQRHERANRQSNNSAETAAAICFTFIWFHAARRRRLIAERTDQGKVDALSRSLIPGVPVNAAVTLVALWSPYTALVLFAALNLFYVFGSSLFERD